MLRLLVPLIFGLAGSKAGWIYATMFQRDQPLTHFQKAISRYFGYFIAGMSYIVLWQFELADMFHTDSAWRWLLALWTILISYAALRSIRKVRIQENETEHPDFRKLL